MVDPTVRDSASASSEDPATPATETEPIAIIGIGCRFPGGANSPETFWRLLCDEVDAITEVPAGRFDIDALYDPRPATPGKIVTRCGGFLDQVGEFDASFFDISPREAVRMDPQQRLLLEVAWEALEDAGQVRDKLIGSQSGVFIGMTYNDYEDLQLRRSGDIDIHTATGSFRSSAAGRLSYVLGLQGPSMVIDTSASSSLVSVHLACQSLRSRECTLALAGGVNLILHLEHSLGFSWAKMLAPDGRCKFCDARANGFVRSEGVGLVVLKPLTLAVAEDDPIYAVIRGSAVNNDGNTSLLIKPSRQGQEAVLRRAYRSAGISPGQVHYLECHGTGTPIGDLVEVQALGAVVAEGRPNDRPCAIGSVKTNIGHTEGAAGIAGLIKAALCLKQRAIPANLHIQELNPNIPWQELPLVVQRELASWPADSEPALAGVSSFGITGTNAHVVLREFRQTNQAHEEETMSPGKPHLLTLSARCPGALEAMVRAYQTFLTTDGNGASPSLRDICYTASARRTHHDYRLALVVRSREELVEQLAFFLQEEIRSGMSSGHGASDRQHKIVFVFSGQGSQWVGMGQELLEQEPVFREALERCDQAMQKHVDWSLLERLTANEAQSRSDEVDVIQPMIFAIQMALAALWRSWGIEPGAVVGQSMGEAAAAYVAGALSLEDVTRVICLRSRLVKRTSGQGGMAVVGLSLEEAQRALVGHGNRVSVAVSSSPASTVLSGDRTALEEILDLLERRGVFYRWVKVDYASHSPQMDPVCPELLQALRGLRPRRASLSIYSTVTGELSDGVELDATYWSQNLRKPVLFWPTIQRLVESNYNIFLEVSPHPVALSTIQQCLRHLGRKGAVLPSLRREEGERAMMLGALGTLYTLGYTVDWNQFYPAGRCVRLPSYPWQRQRFWHEHQETADGRIPSPQRPDRDVGGADQEDFSVRSHETTEGLSRDALLAAEPEDRQRLLESYICQQLARTLEFSSSKLDVQQPLARLGLDSLMAAELAHRIETDLGMFVPVVSLLKVPSIAQLATQMCDKSMTQTPISPACSATQESAEQLLARLDQLSGEEVDSLLGDLLAEKEFDQ